MTHSLYILLGIFFFWASTVLTAIFECQIASLPLCLLIYSLPVAPKRLVSFFIAAYLLEQFLWHGVLGVPILSIFPTLVISRYLKRMTLISLHAMHIITIVLYLTIARYSTMYLFYEPSTSFSQFIHELIFSISILTILSFAMDSQPDGT